MSETNQSQYTTTDFASDMLDLIGKAESLGASVYDMYIVISSLAVTLRMEFEYAKAEALEQSKKAKENQQKIDAIRTATN